MATHRHGQKVGEGMHLGRNVQISVSHLLYEKLKRLGEMADPGKLLTLRGQVQKVVKIAVQELVREAEAELPELRTINMTDEGRILDRSERLRVLRSVRYQESLRIAWGRKIEGFSEFQLPVKDRWYVKNRVEEARLRALTDQSRAKEKVPGRVEKKGSGKVRVGKGRVVEGQSRRVRG